MSYFFLRVKSIGRLNVVTLVTFVAYEVNLIADSLLLAIFVTNYDGHDSDIHIESSDSKFIIYNVLHHVCLFQLPEIQSGIS